jgi:hypothetical protein
MKTLLYQGKPTQTEDLQKAIDDGINFGCNHSPTIRAKLIEVKGGVSVLEVVENPVSYMKEYNEKAKNEIGKRFTLPSYIVWNSIYF